MQNQNFLNTSHSCLNALFTQIESTYPDLDIDLGQESLSIAVTAKMIFLITINNTAQQIWLSSPVTGGHHFFYDAEYDVWISTRDDTCQLFMLLNQELSDVVRAVT